MKRAAPTAVAAVTPSGQATEEVGDVPSPCTSVCRMDEASGWCEGCLRTLDEIAEWGTLDAAGRRVILARLGARRAAWERRTFGGAPVANDAEAR